MNDLGPIPILIINSNAQSLKELEALLHTLSDQSEIIKATSSEDALLKLHKHEYAVILLDVQLHDMTWAGIAGLIRANPETSDTPIIFITDNVQTGATMTHASRVGVIDYLQKPIDNDLLCGKVTIFCELYKLRKKIEKQNALLASRIDDKSREVSSLSMILSETEIEQRKTQKELAESERRMRSVIDSSYEAFFCVDIDGRILDWNKQASSLFGVERDEIFNKRFVDVFIPERNREAHVKGRSEFVSRSEFDPANGRFEVRALHKSGREIPVEISLWRIPGGSEPLFGAFIRDITDRKNAEKAMKTLNEKLEQRVIERTRELEQSRQTALNSERLASLGSLVAGVAHEMNTPIGNCVSLASTLQANANKLVGDLGENKVRRSDMEKFLSDMQHGHEILVRNLARAATLVQSFKQVAVDQTSNQRRKFNLKKALEEDVVTIGPMFKKTPFKINMILADDITLDSYPGPLGQIITNFVSNSLMHGFHGRDAGMMLLCTKLIDSHTVEILYEDDGVGINPKHLNHIFDPFFTTKLGQGGSGLGLSIVHNLVVGVLGGTIVVESAANQGTRFQLVLPIVAPEIVKS